MIWISYLISLSRPPGTMLNRSGKTRHLCLVPNLRGKAFSFLPLSIMLAVGFSYMVYIMLRYFNIPSIPSLLSVFVWHERVFNFHKFFYRIFWDYHVIFFTIHSVKVVYHIDFFLMLKHPCIPGINSSCS